MRNLASATELANPSTPMVSAASKYRTLSDLLAELRGGPRPVHPEPLPRDAAAAALSGRG